jgi:hypothetical protein
VAEPLLSGAVDHAAQLAKMGLRLDFFYDALHAGEQARRLVSKNAPKNAPGTDDYFQRVSVLRERLTTEARWPELTLTVSPW